MVEKAAIKDFEKAKQISSGAIPRLPPSPSRPRLPGGPRLAGSRMRHSFGGAAFVKADAWRYMDWCRKISEQMTGQPFGASMPLVPPDLGPPGGPGLASE